MLKIGFCWDFQYTAELSRAEQVWAEMRKGCEEGRVWIGNEIELFIYIRQDFLYNGKWGPVTKVDLVLELNVVKKLLSRWYQEVWEDQTDCF